MLSSQNKKCVLWISVLNMVVIMTRIQLTLCVSPNNRNKLPLILWWHSGVYPRENNNRVNTVQCGKTRCLSSAFREYLQDHRTKVIVFYGTRLSPEDLPFPRRIQHQWALIHEESPMNNYILSHELFLELFNHTATFSRYSDYPITTNSIFSEKYLIARKPVPLPAKNLKIKTENLAPVLYVQSHRNVASDRDTYVNELMKHIKIDSYGKCLHNKNLPQNLEDPASSFQSKEFHDYIAQYKFHIAFENAICDDYFTEKVLRPLHVGSIPIYYGSPNIIDWMPNNKSVILAKDFESPYELAEYIKYLNENDEEYNKYLTFKEPGGITNQRLLQTLVNRDWGTQDGDMYIYNEENKDSFFSGFECHICKKLHQQREESDQNGKDELKINDKTDITRMSCPRPFPSTGDPHRILPNGYWGALDWQEAYDDDRFRAMVVRRMLEANEADSSKFWKYYENMIHMKQSLNKRDEL